MQYHNNYIGLLKVSIAVWLDVCRFGKVQPPLLDRRRTLSTAPFLLVGLLAAARCRWDRQCAVAARRRRSDRKPEQASAAF